MCCSRTNSGWMARDKHFIITIWRHNFIIAALSQIDAIKSVPGGWDSLSFCILGSFKQSDTDEGWTVLLFFYSHQSEESDQWPSSLKIAPLTFGVRTTVSVVVFLQNDDVQVNIHKPHLSLDKPPVPPEKYLEQHSIPYSLLTTVTWICHYLFLDCYSTGH